MPLPRGSFHFDRLDIDFWIINGNIFPNLTHSACQRIRALEWAMPHATGRSHGGQSRRQNANHDLNNRLPRFLSHFFHSSF